MTVLESDCDGLATMINSESVMLSFNSNTGPLFCVERTLRVTIPAVGYRGSCTDA